MAEEAAVLKYHKSAADAAAEAEQKGFEVVWSTPTTLLLDLDDQDSQNWYEAQMDIFQGGYEDSSWKSKSGTGRHVVIQLFEETPLLERIALQAMLGSDRKRELLAYYRIKAEVPHNEISVLFKPKGTK